MSESKSAGQWGMTDEQAYPLHWPQGWPRTPDRERGMARFHRSGRDLSMRDSVERLRGQFGYRKFVTEKLVISTNVELRRDGLPYSNRRAPVDPGAAVYFKMDGQSYAMPCDRWDRVEDNLAAIAAHLEAMRGQERWGVGSLDRAFAGYAALPAPEPEEPWWRVLGIEEHAPLAAVEAHYRSQAKIAHPDSGGSHEGMARLTRAIQQAREAK